MSREKVLDNELSKELEKKMRFLWDRKCYQLNESEFETKWISRIPESKPERYNPFDYYLSGERKKDSLHLIFASLDPYDPHQISEFCFNWGMLGLFQHEYRQYYLPNDIQHRIGKAENDDKEIVLFGPRLGGTQSTQLDDLGYIASRFNISDEKVSRLQSLESTEVEMNVETSESIEDISFEIQRFSELISLRVALKNKNFEAVKEIIHIHDDLTGEEVLDRGQSVISGYLAAMLDGNVTPIIKWIGGTPDLKWKCETLIESIYMMLMFDIMQDVNIKKCPHCKDWFSYTKMNPAYCSPECQDRAKSARYKLNAKKKLENRKGEG